MKQFIRFQPFVRVVAIECDIHSGTSLKQRLKLQFIGSVRGNQDYRGNLIGTSSMLFSRNALQ